MSGYITTPTFRHPACSTCAALLQAVGRLPAERGGTHPGLLTKDGHATQACTGINRPPSCISWLSQSLQSKGLWHGWPAGPVCPDSCAAPATHLVTQTTACGIVLSPNTYTQTGAPPVQAANPLVSADELAVPRWPPFQAVMALWSCMCLAHCALSSTQQTPASKAPRGKRKKGSLPSLLATRQCSPSPQGSADQLGYNSADPCVSTGLRCALCPCLPTQL